MISFYLKVITWLGHHKFHSWFSTIVNGLRMKKEHQSVIWITTMNRQSIKRLYNSCNEIIMSVNNNLRNASNDALFLLISNFLNSIVESSQIIITV